MRTLYFDLDGTLIGTSSGRPKPRLLGGAFEDAVRAAGFETIVCVGTFAGVVRHMTTLRLDYDGPGAILRLCGDVFRDEAWFRRVLSLVEDPATRGAAFALDSDWWYVDDHAEAFLSRVGRHEVLRAERGRRICVPEPNGDGADILDWLRSVS